jgi:hypothetical protein
MTPIQFPPIKKVLRKLSRFSVISDGLGIMKWGVGRINKNNLLSPDF